MKNALPDFLDSELISEWAEPYVAMSASMGLISGRPDGTFDPKNYANREMAAVMCENFLDALVTFPGEHSPSYPSNPYRYMPASQTNLSIFLNHRIFIYDQEQQVKLTISGPITVADADKRANLVVTIDHLTSEDITFKAIEGFGMPEIIQEGNGSSPLIVAWGGTDGASIAPYLINKARLSMSIEIPTTLHKKGLYSFCTI